MPDPPSLRVAFLGNAEWSVPPLEALAASSHRVVVVATRTPRPGRRGGADVPTPVAVAGRRLGIPVSEVASVKTGPGFDALATVRPDVLAVVAYGEILPAHVLRLPMVAPVNLHFSLLPALRGPSPVQTALLLDLDRTGVTTIVMDEGLDSGPILDSREEAIGPEDDAGSLGGRLAELGGGVLVRSIDALAAGTAEPIAQDDARATFSRRIGPEDRWIDWTAPAGTVANLVRALSPTPSAVTTFRGAALRVFRVRVVDRVGSPGQIVGVAPDGFEVAAGEGALRLLDVAPAGRRRMSGAAFASGARPTVGERLG